jgi:hypothetical protein
MFFFSNNGTDSYSNDHSFLSVVDLKVQYDPFQGQGSWCSLLASIEDDLRDVLMDWRPEILSAYTSITDVNEDNV